MKILTFVGLIRTIQEPIDAIIVIVNNAYILANIMDAVRLTGLKPKTITSAMIFEANPTMMQTTSIDGVVVPVFFNPIDAKRGLSEGTYMGTSAEFKKRVDANYK